MSPSTTRPTESSKSQMNAISGGSAHGTKDGDNKDKPDISVPPDVQDLYPQTQVICQNGITRSSPTTESLFTKIVRSADCHQSVKSSGTLTDSLRNIKNENRGKLFENIINDGVETPCGKNSITELIQDGSIETKMDECDSTAMRSSPIHRPSLTAAIASSTYSGEDSILAQPVVSQHSPTSKIKAVIQNVQKNGNKSKILMVLALCILCLPGNIVTLWLKCTEYNVNSLR